MRAAVWHLRVFLGMGLVFAALSELWFYPISGIVGLFELTLYYAVAAHVGLLVMMRLGAGGWLGFYLAAAFLGFVIEAVPVFEFFSAMPMTIVWTSMAWHGLVSGVLGIWMFRAAAARGLWWFVGYAALFGGFLGLWAGYYWSVEPEGLRFGEQLPWAFGMFALGHVLIPAARSWQGADRWVMWIGGAVIAFFFAVAGLWMFFPLSLALPVMVGLTFFAGRGVVSNAPLWADIPVSRFWVLLIVPVFAVAVYDLSEGTAWISELNALVFLIAGPVSVGLLAWCLWRAIKKGRPTSAL